jgi:hypothetical protein
MVIRPAFFASSALAIALLAGCESAPKVSGAVPSSAKLTEAATSPLGDLNLVREAIPAILEQARKAPYETPADRSCDALATELVQLEAALGADLDVPPTDSNPGLVERGAHAAGDAAVGAVRRTAEGLIPYRGWLRKLTGAERYSREVAAAIAAGSIRRAYLKGLGRATGCEPPAAPRDTMQ